MKKIALLSALLFAGAAHADDGLSLGVGVDYTSGKYGTDTTTDITSIPFTAKYASGNWTYKASLPWVHVSGNPNVLPGLGEIPNSNPHGRGRGQGNSGGGGGGTGTPVDSGSASGIGDLRLAATYSFDTGSPLGVDLTGNVKIATADADKGLGTGANDYGVAVDLYRAVGAATLFGGVGYTKLGTTQYIDVNGVANANVGASWKVGTGSVGAMYDYRQAASSASDPRSEVTGFYSLGAGPSGKVQFYATAGLSDGSPDWGGGVSYTHGF
jgi:hypothetical protein